VKINPQNVRKCSITVVLHEKGQSERMRGGKLDAMNASFVMAHGANCDMLRYWVLDGARWRGNGQPVVCQRGGAFVDVVCHNVPITVFTFFRPFFSSSSNIPDSSVCPFLSLRWLARLSRISTPSHCFTHPATSFSYLVRLPFCKDSPFASPVCKKDKKFCYEKKEERLFCFIRASLHSF